MFQNDNYFTINDLSPAALILWASPSIINCLGYEPEEVVGVSPYHLIHPDDITGSRVAHKETLVNEIAGTQLFVRLKRKNGTYIPFMALGIICFHYLISCLTIMNEEDGSKATMEFERISRNHKNLSSTWNPVNFDMELRACLFLNRFTRNLCIMYASPSCGLILNIDPNDLIGKPLLLFIRADDLASFVEQADSAKTTATVRHLRFWFQSPNCHQEIPLEAIFLGAADALIIIFRTCLPFRRKQFITNFSSQHFIGNSSTRSRFSNKSGRNHNILTGSNSRSTEKAEPYSRSGHVHSIRRSSTDFLSSPPGPRSPRSDGTRVYQAPLRSVHMGSINSIRNLDNDQTRLRPLASFHEEEIESKAKHLIREFHTQDSEVETYLVEEFEKTKLTPDRKEAIERKEDTVEKDTAEKNTEEEDMKKKGIEEEKYADGGSYFDGGREIATTANAIDVIQIPYPMTGIGETNKCGPE
ncbi:hypothetical protein BGX20_010943 [Mortierella sp. AD010]|nr:hypothetical protein BGX20_010943 [Mortierella sp. AD010]